MEPTNNAKSIWSATLGLLELEIPRPNFETWLKDTVAYSLEDNQLIIYTTSPFAAEMLEKRLHSTISRAVHKISNKNIEIIFKVKNESQNNFLDNKKIISNNTSKNKNFNQEKESNLNKYFTFDNFIRGTNNELALAAAKKFQKNQEKFIILYIFTQKLD